MADVVLLVALVLTGLQAGTYYAWASGVMPGLARVDDRTFVHAMGRINVAIVNPVFLTSFLGAPLLSVVAVFLVDGDARPWTVVGAVAAVATVLITATGNIPLNNALDAAGPVDDMPDPGAVRTAFERRWVRLNAARAATSTVSLAALGWAALS